jgi:hypothetical protein
MGKQHTRAAALVACALLGATSVWRVWGQSPEAVVLGTVTGLEGQPIPAATVTATQAGTGFTQTGGTGSRGEYAFLALPRGAYNVKATKPGYQGLEKQGIELALGDRLVVDFSLSPIAASPALVEDLLKSLPPAPGLPAETVASSVSVVIDEDKILRLPLADRNIYSLFLLQPGVTSQGAIVGRGLSFAVHGQRVSGSNYILDGVDNNDIVLTGPVTIASAEGVQEFRMTNSSFSAENGRATSFVAQVVTRSGTNGFHGSLFEFFSHDRLNANSSFDNATATERLPMRQNQFGFSLGGPIFRNRTFFSSTLELSRLRYDSRTRALLPSASYIAALPQDSVARRILTDSPPVSTVPVPGDPNVGLFDGRSPNRLDTLRAAGRIDQQFGGGKDRLVIAYNVSGTDVRSSDASQSAGYPKLLALDRYRAHTALLAWTHSPVGGTVNSVRIGWSRARRFEPRPYGQIPIVQTFEDVLLPGSPRQTDQRENNNVIQLSDTWSFRRGRSGTTLGAELRRNLEDGLTLGIQNEAFGGTASFPDGFYLFPDLASFAAAYPIAFAIGVDRFSQGVLRRPDLSRQYRSTDYAAFVLEDLKLTRRLSLTLGLRHEYFGIPHNLDRSKDVNFYFGPGADIEQRLASGILRPTDQNSGDLKGLLYRRDWLSFAPSIGLAWDPLGGGRTVVRAGYAIAFDRVFDTVRDVRSNTQEVATCGFNGCAPEFLLPVDLWLPRLNPNLPPYPFMQLDENLRTPYAQNWYLGIQQTVTPNFLVELGHVGSTGRKLVSRDLVNRPPMSLNPSIGLDTFLSNADSSNYLALELGLRRRFSRGLQYQVSYTYSHAIDNQSDLFEGVRTGPGPLDFAVAGLTRQFDPRTDRGNANFDQRHNLIFNAIWDLPAPRFQARWSSWLAQGWTATVIGGYRSGFPVTVVSSPDLSADGLYSNRVDYVGAGQHSTRTAVPGGVQWLDPSQFRAAVNRVGTLGRGALRGPGFWNYDFALLRNFGRAEGRVQTQFRTEFYNLFNHANLSVPLTRFLDRSNPAAVDAQFGQAFYGVNRTHTRFGELPLDDPSRRIQFALRIRF